IRFRGLIHEFPSSDDSPSGLQAVVAPISIVHHGYLKDIVAERNKGQRNLDIVRAAAEQDPSDPFHWFNLGNTAFLVGDYEQAREALEEMFRRNGDAKRGFIPNGYAVLAETYTDKLGDPVRGEAIARQALVVAPHYANAHFLLGKALVAQQRLDEARIAYQEAIADGAFAHLQFVIDDQVYIWKAQCEIGSTYVMQGDDERAIEWFKKALDAAPNVQPVQINYARALTRLGRRTEAQEILRLAYETHRDDMSTIDYVNALLAVGIGMKALEVIAASHERLTDSAAVALLIAGYQIAQKNSMPVSESFLNAAAQRDPGNADVLNPLEMLMRNRGDNAAVDALLAREAATAPKSAADYLRRSFQAISTNRFADALALAQGGIALAPSDALLHYNAAIASVNLGNKEEALEHLGFLDDRHEEAYQRGELLRAVILREQGEHRDALAALDRLLAIVPDQVDAILARASLLEAMHDVESAEKALKAAFTLEPQRIGVELAGLYMRAGRFADAAEIAERALANQPS
ncbi:MAG: tetratricopeptide repeat protein, partial [Vulcanimicrobiaceae bacterium]